MHFTDEQYKQLEPLEKYFQTAVYSGYKSGTFLNTNKMVNDIYNAATGKNIPRNLNCSVCVFNLFKECGTLYFEDKNNREKKNKKKKNGNK